MLCHNLTLVEKHYRNGREQQVIEECIGEILPGLVVAVVMMMMMTMAMINRPRCALGIVLSAWHG